MCDVMVVCWVMIEYNEMVFIRIVIYNKYDIFVKIVIDLLYISKSHIKLLLVLNYFLKYYIFWCTQILMSLQLLKT